MGFWNDGIRPASRSNSHSRSRSRSRSRSPSRHSRRAPSQSSSKHYSARPSFARSASSIFGGVAGGGGGSYGGSQSGAGGPRGSTSRGRSYSTVQPRRGFVARVRRFLRQLYEYMRKHPFKVFVLVIMPLITGGALSKLFAAVGIRLPRNVERFVGADMSRGVPGNQRFYARGGARDMEGGSALPGIGESVQGAISIAKMFM